MSGTRRYEVTDTSRADFPMPQVAQSVAEERIRDAVWLDGREVVGDLIVTVTPAPRSTVTVHLEGLAVRARWGWARRWWRRGRQGLARRLHGLARAVDVQRPPEGGEC